VEGFENDLGVGTGLGAEEFFNLTTTAVKLENLNLRQLQSFK